MIDDAPLPPISGTAVDILNELVRTAVARKASDIHLEPRFDHTQVRMRVDGAMARIATLDGGIAQQVTSRIKVLSKMDIAERRHPQDGQLALELPDGPLIQMRAATYPTPHGEKVVLRLLLVGRSMLSVSMLGMDPGTQERIESVALRPQGFVVACGPTGSGKTSTLYALLQLIDPSRINVVTLEDPIEIELEGITQGQINDRSGFTFATGLKAILRQDPDVIMVGEMRDAETAGIGLQAALTGHLVFSSLHTSDCVETIVRLVDLGVEPWIVANALTAVIAQRLVRLACPHCRVVVRLESDLWDDDELLLQRGTEVGRAIGCEYCLHTGFKGRTGLFQVLEVDDEVRELVKVKAGPRAFRDLLNRRNVPSLRRVGFEKVLSGHTTVDEVIRVTT